MADTKRTCQRMRRTPRTYAKTLSANSAIIGACSKTHVVHAGCLHICSHCDITHRSDRDRLRTLGKVTIVNVLMTSAQSCTSMHFPGHESDLEQAQMHCGRELQVHCGPFRRMLAMTSLPHIGLCMRAHASPSVSGSDLSASAF